MPDDEAKAWSDELPVHSAAPRCRLCPKRGNGVCSLIRMEGLENLVTYRRYQRRTLIQGDGEPVRHALVFRSGVVSVARPLSSGRRQVLDFLMAGDVLGFGNESTMGLTVGVLEDAEVCRFPLEALLDRRRSPRFLRGLIAVVEAATERVREHVVLLGKSKAEERVIAFLLRYRAASRRVSVAEARIELPMTQRDIADHLGLASETVCRALSWLQDERVIVQSADGIHILDLQRLESLGDWMAPVLKSATPGLVVRRPALAAAPSARGSGDSAAAPSPVLL